jgi:hypothetical protein
LSKGEKTSNDSNRYDLKSKKKDKNPDISEWPARAEKPAKDIVDSNKERKAQIPPLVVKSPILEVKEILNPPSPYSFEHEIQNIRIPISLSELVKDEDFKRCLSKKVHPEPTSHSTDSVNL